MKCNNLLTLGVRSVLVGLLISGLGTSARSADSIPNVTGGSQPSAEMRRAPVPLVRNVPSVLRTSPAVEPAGQTEPSESKPYDGLGRKAAKAAVEAAGRLTVGLSK